MFLLDTNVVSELRKVRSGKANVHVTRWTDAVEAFQLYISAITLLELELGVLLLERYDTRQGRIMPGSHIARRHRCGAALRAAARARSEARTRRADCGHRAGAWADNGNAECGGLRRHRRPPAQPVGSKRLIA